MTDAAALFEAERQQLISLCYRMLGDRAGAEDAVQDTWLRWMGMDHAQVIHPAAWLRRAATNIAIDALKSARRQRETYVGPWLPEPLMPTTTGMEDRFELAQECELALLWAMERLNEEERAAYILREAFDAGYDEISTSLGKTQAACRQMVSRAHKRLQQSGPRFDAPPEEVQELIVKFFAAAAADDFETAMAVLAPDASAISDGGRKARAARRALRGPEDITQVLLAVWRKSSQEVGWTIEPTLTNRKPAIIRRMDKKIDTVITLAPNEGGAITWLYVMRNPDKLPSSN